KRPAARGSDRPNGTWRLPCGSRAGTMSECPHRLRAQASTRPRLREQGACHDARVRETMVKALEVRLFAGRVDQRRRVARCHQAGFSASDAASRSLSEEKRAKQVAPDPDMRTRVVPGASRRAARTSPISGTRG